MNRGFVFAVALVATGLLTPTMVTASEPAGVVQASPNQVVVERLYRAFAAGDGATIATILSSDLVWFEAENHPYADLNPYNGPAAVVEGVFGRIGAAFPDFVVTPTTYLSSGDTVAAQGRYTATNIATGETMDAQFVHFFTVRDVRITGFQQYTDTAQWIDVVTPD